MPRSRNIKPGICKNEHLVTLSFEARFLAAVLPCWADRRGRMEDRPLKLKMEIFPADDLNVNDLLNDLEGIGYVQRYEAENSKYIQIVNFEKHQNPHCKEADSTIPAQCKNSASTVQDTTKAVTSHADSFNPVPDSFQKKGQPKPADRFSDWWAIYPKKVKKKTAREIWKRKRLDTQADALIADVKKRLREDRRFQSFTPDPTTYLNQERWDDEIQKSESPASLPRDEHSLNRYARENNLPSARPGESLEDWRQRLAAAL